jgi:hypothetical protein
MAEGTGWEWLWERNILWSKTKDVFLIYKLLQLVT